jgi:hypothetical protein
MSAPKMLWNTIMLEKARTGRFVLLLSAARNRQLTEFGIPGQFASRVRHVTLVKVCSAFANVRLELLPNSR